MRPQKIANALLRPINPELTLADSVVDALLAVGTFRLRDKRKPVNQQAAPDWSFAEQTKR